MTARRSIIAKSVGGFRQTLRRLHYSTPLLLVLLLIATAGCRQTAQKQLAERLQPLPDDAAPILSWQAARSNLATYWGTQEVKVRLRGFIPEDWRQTGDARWELAAESNGGRNVPFLGVIHNYTNENGTKLKTVLPELDLKLLPDGLYMLLEPGIEKNSDGHLGTISPVAVLCEIRNHTFKPFQVKFHMVPAVASALTPMPAALPAAPPGTPVPVR